MVAQLFRQQGHSVVVYLQDGQSACESYRSGGGKVREVFGEIDVYGRESFSSDDVRFCACDAVICAMSPVSGFNVLNMEISALHAGKIANLPIYGVSDFPGSWQNPGWREYSHNLTTLFSPMPEPNAPCSVVVSGWGALEKWRGEDVQTMAKKARAILNINDDQSVLVVSFSPERESPLALEHLACLIKRSNLRNKVIVVNRHGRERTSPIAGNGLRYYEAMRLLMEDNFVIDNSPEFADMADFSNDYAISPLFAPSRFLDYRQMLALTANNGLYLSFFGTDALVAPYLASQGVLSALWLDPVLGGAVLKREKQVESLDFPYVYRPTNDEHLISCLNAALGQDDHRAGQLSLLTQHYPFPEKPASQIIVDEILRQLG